MAQNTFTPTGSETHLDARTVWNGNATDAENRLASIEGITGSFVDDAVYGGGWDGDITSAPSKNAVYDKIETLGGGGGHTIQDEGTPL
jgi:hypothetical protein